MGVFKKLKDVLFDIEEEEIPVIKKEEVVDNNPIKEIKIPKEEVTPSPVEPVKNQSFNFPLDFDDEMPSRTVKKDYLFNDDFEEKTVKREYKRYDEPVKKKPAFDYSKFSSREVKREDNKPFKPSPVISPVYGILNQNYSKDDVIVKSDVGIKNPSLDEALDKAHGIKTKKERIFDEEFDEPLKTLDEILISKDKLKDEDNVELPIKKTIKKSVEIKEEVKIEDDDKNVVIPKEETSLEDDLFSLIDSMYEEREEMLED